MGVVWLYPMARVIALSLSDPTAILLGEVDWYPKRPTLKGYSYILSYRLLWRAYANTVLYAGVGTFVTITLTSMIAYSLSIKTFVLRKFLTVYLTITMFFSGGLIPTFLLIKTLGGMDTFWVMVIPGSVAAFTVIVFRTFFQNHPESLRESAYIDGANDITILFRIILPMSTALLATFALFTIVGHWNRWFEALIYLTDPQRHPLQMILRRAGGVGGHAAPPVRRRRSAHTGDDGGGHSSEEHTVRGGGRRPGADRDHVSVRAAVLHERADRGIAEGLTGVWRQGGAMEGS